MPSKGDRGGYLEQLSDVLIQVLPVTRNGGSGVVFRMADIFREPGKAAIPLSGSRVGPAHDGSWVDC